MNTRNKKLILTFITSIVSAHPLIGMEPEKPIMPKHIHKKKSFWRSPKDQFKSDILTPQEKTAAYEYVLSDGFGGYEISPDEDRNNSFADLIEHGNATAVQLIFKKNSDLSILPRLISIVQNHKTVTSLTMQVSRNPEPRILILTPELIDGLNDLLKNNKKLSILELCDIEGEGIETLFTTAKESETLTTFVFNDKVIKS